jgi:hypothetical protein
MRKRVTRFARTIWHIAKLTFNWWKTEGGMVGKFMVAYLAFQVLTYDLWGTWFALLFSAVLALMDDTIRENEQLRKDNKRLARAVAQRTAIPRLPGHIE